MTLTPVTHASVSPPPPNVLTYLVRARAVGHGLTGQRLQGLHHFQLLLVEALQFLLLEEFFNFLTQQSREASEIQSVFTAAGGKVLKCPAEKPITLLLSENTKLKAAWESHSVSARFYLLLFLRAVCFYKRVINTSLSVALGELCHLVDIHDR